MSIDIIARALASQAGNNASSAQSNATAASQRAGIIDLFANIGSRVIDASINLVSTGGHATAGQGAWRYVSDSLATSALAASYPLLCRQSGDGRYWRALPDTDGLVPLYAAGVIGFATPTYTTNQQPAIQQVIDYCFAVGASGAVCEVGKHYCAWTPSRATTGTNINTDKTGVPFQINRNAASVGYFRLKGNGSTIWRRMVGGADPSTVGSWQTLTTGVYWRGGLFLLVGASSAPANSYARTSLHLQNIKLMGGIPFVSPGAGTFNAATGQGWDITDKAIWAENDRYTGDIIYEGDVQIDGFGGEHHYQGGATHGAVYQYGGTLTSSNSGGDGFNPCPTYSQYGTTTAPNSIVYGGTVQMESLRLRNCYQALEGSTGWKGWINNIRIEDCTNAGGLMAGLWWQATQPNGNPIAPILSINRVVVERSANFSLQRGNRIKSITCQDSNLMLGSSNGYAVYAIDIDVANAEVIADQGNVSDAVTFYGTTTSGSKGTYQNHIRHLRVSQSDNAIANGYRVANPCGYYNSLGDQNFVHKISGYSVNGPASRNVSTVTDYHVGFGDLSALNIQNPVNSVNIETTPALTLYDPIVAVYNSSSSGLFAFTLPSPNGKLPKGSRRRLVASTTGTSVYALGTANTRSDRSYLMRNGEQIELECDGFAWRIAQPPSSTRLNASGSLTWSAIAAGATSAEQTVTLNGLKLSTASQWRVYAAPPSGGFVAGLVINARISADNTVAVSITNTSGASLTPAAGGITVYAETLV